MEASTLQIHLGNPAGRLYAFMGHLRLGGDPNSATSQHVARYFELEPGAPGSVSPELFRALSEILMLPDQMEEAVRNRTTTGAPNEVLLRPLQRVRPALTALGSSIHIGLQQFRAQYQDSDVNDLEHCSYALMQEGALGIDSQRIEKIRDLARSIMELVRESDEELDAEVRTLIWEHAKKISDAADLARAGGSGLLVEAYDEVFGHLLRRQDLGGRVSKSTIGKKFVELLSTISVFITVIQGAAGLPADLRTLLELVPGSQASIVAPGPVSDDPSVGGAI